MLKELLARFEEQRRVTGESSFPLLYLDCRAGGYASPAGMARALYEQAERELSVMDKLKGNLAIAVKATLGLSQDSSLEVELKSKVNEPSDLGAVLEFYKNWLAACRQCGQTPVLIIGGCRAVGAWRWHRVPAVGAVGSPDACSRATLGARADGLSWVPQTRRICS